MTDPKPKKGCTQMRTAFFFVHRDGIWLSSIKTLFKVRKYSSRFGYFGTQYIFQF